MKNNYFWILTMLIFLSINNVFATDYYIDPVNGNDSNEGLSSTTAFQNLYKIDNLNLEPGDVVYFMEGTYTRSGTLLTINESGTEGNYITFKNYEGHTPVLEFDSWTGIDIIGGSSYIKIDGLHIKGARSKVNLEDALNQGGSCAQNFSGGVDGFYNGTGILAVGPNLKWSNSATTSVPHHIIVENCEVYDCTSSGIAFQQADYVTINNNKVYNNCWYTIYGTSGINLYQLVNIDGTTGFHNEITNNLMYGNQLLVPQVSLELCEFLDGNGLIVDDLKHTQRENYKDASINYGQYFGKTLISNNVAVENGGSGLHFYLSNRCHIYNNTIANNAFQNDGVNGNAELRIGICTDFFVKNNIFKSEYTVHHIETTERLDYSHNYQFGPDILEEYANCEGCVENTELEFLNTDITSNTPFITDYSSILTNAGTDIIEVTNDYIGSERPYNEFYDIGAYELYDCELITWYADVDEDGFGNENNSITSCEQPDGYVAKSGDQCDEDVNKTEPGECGCGIEEGTCVTCDEETIWYSDIDGDGYGDDNDTISDCEQPDGYVAESGDSCPTDPNKIDPLICGCGVEEGTCEAPDLCDSPEYQDSTIYDNAGFTVLYEGMVYQNNWYTQGQIPSNGGPWVVLDVCESNMDCSVIQEWAENQVYPNAGSQVIHNGKVYENKWYANAGMTPDSSDVWQLNGLCEEIEAFSTLSVAVPVISNSNNQYEIIIYNIVGQTILKENLERYELSTFISKSDIPNGIYVSKITNLETGEVTTKKEMKIN